MNIRKSIALALALAVVGTGVASADNLILDTGTPPMLANGTPANNPATLNTVNWYAAEFYATAGQTITELSAYLYPGTGGNSGSFTWDIYSSTGFLANAHLSALYSSAGSFSSSAGTGEWSSLNNVNWTPTASGYYWVALQVSSTTQTHGIDLPVESSATGGTAPATAFAYAGTNHQYSTLNGVPVGLEVSAVPLPAAVWLLGSGLMGLGLFGRRRVKPTA